MEVEQPKKFWMKLQIWSQKLKSPSCTGELRVQKRYFPLRNLIYLGVFFLLRFNIGAYLLDKPSTRKELGLAAILVWFRYSATRQLTWNKNYNVKPRCSIFPPLHPLLPTFSHHFQFCSPIFPPFSPFSVLSFLLFSPISPPLFPTILPSFSSLSPPPYPLYASNLLLIFPLILPQLLSISPKN